MHPRRTVTLTLGLSSAFVLAACATKQPEPPPSSPPAAPAPVPAAAAAASTVEHPTRVFFGDTHLHTGMSLDAGAAGARLLPADAYRFAKGEEVASASGQKAKLSRPLDFLVVADHSDQMGFISDLIAGNPELLKNPKAKKWHDLIKAGKPNWRMVDVSSRRRRHGYHHHRFGH